MAAATAGETRWVRPPLPWRPSKLRLEVEALRSPGASWSGFMPRHIEQPASRHSAPAAMKTLSRPSASACSRPSPSRARRASRRRRRPCDRRRTRRRRAGPRCGRWCTSRGRRCRRRCRAAACPACRSMYSRARSAAGRSSGRRYARAPGTARRQRRALAGVGAPGDERRRAAGVDDDLVVEDGVVVGAQRPPVGDGRVPVRARSARAGGPGGSRRSSRRARSCRRARPPRWTCCRPSCAPPSTARGWPRRGTR